MINVLVPLKRVPDPFAKVRPLPDGSGLDTDSVKCEINPFDEIALEGAVRLREAGAELEIIAISIGSDSEDQLRKGLAMGADRAILVEQSGLLDSLSTATELAAHAVQNEVNLILMGKQASDDDAGQAGQMLAAKLGWPQASYASAISIEGTGVKVTRETDSGSQTVLAPLPAVVTADLRLAEPRYIALPGIIKARSKPLARVDRLTDAAANVRTTSFEAAPPRKAGRKVASVDELIAALKSEGALS